MNKPAETKYPILEPIQARWSPRAFAPTPVEAEKLGSVFEAARWAASAFNEQPWRFIVATKDQPDEYARALGCLVEANQDWAQHAPVLVLTAACTCFKMNNEANRVAVHDLGLAVSQLVLQATALGLATHQMAGIELEKTRETYNIPENFEPQTALAIGYPGDPAALPEGWTRDAETSPRERLPLDAIVFQGGWDRPSELFV